MNEMIQKIVTTLYDKKAQDIVALDVSGMTVITDCMVIASGRSALQVKTLADEVEDRLSEGGVYPLLQGRPAGGPLGGAGLRHGARAHLSYGRARILPPGQALGG